MDPAVSVPLPAAAPARSVADRRMRRLLRLPEGCTQRQFTARWRSFLKANHPDLNPDQTPEERRRFAEAMGLWNRSAGSWT